MLILRTHSCKPIILVQLLQNHNSGNRKSKVKNELENFPHILREWISLASRKQHQLRAHEQNFWTAITTVLENIIFRNHEEHQSYKKFQFEIELLFHNHRTARA